MGQEMGVLPSDLLKMTSIISEAAIKLECSTSDVVAMVEHALKQGHLDVRPRRSIAATVKEWRRVRLRRNAAMDTTIFRDPAWDMLLDLYCAEHEGKHLTVSQLSYGSGVPIATAIRHIDRMVDADLVKRLDDAKDQRCTIVALTPDAKAKFERFLEMSA